MLKIDKKHYKGINIYYIGYITIKKNDDCESIYSENPLYLQVNHANRYIEDGNKYLIFDDSVDENKDVLKKYNEIWAGAENEVKAINGGECISVKENDYGKDYMKIKFSSNDDLPLNKPLKFNAMIIIIRSVFGEDGKFYRKVFYIMLCISYLYEKMLEDDRIDISEGIDVNKTSASKECDICHFWYFKGIGFKYEPYFCNGCHDLM